VTLDFPNRSRSFDDARNAVRFIGHDGMFEVPFFVEVDALAPAIDSETSYLAAFDAARTTIHEVARRIYGRARRTVYVLAAADFK
jgi:hypothetical protein